MIIQCRACKMRYHLDESVLSSKGSYVRCTRCQQVWFQEPPLSQTGALVTVMPAPVREQRTSLGRRIFRYALFLIISFTFFQIGRLSLSYDGPWMQLSKEIFFGSQALELSSFSFEKAVNGEITCQGILINKGTKNIQNPKIILLFYPGTSLKEGKPEKTEHTLSQVFPPDKPIPFSIATKPPILFSTICPILP